VKVNPFALVVAVYGYIQKRYGSFQKYLDSLDKTNNYANATADLVNKFKWLGQAFSKPFLVHSGRKNRAMVNHTFSFFC